ncbi:Crp/Fnr family transcriptional regulator [Mangrovicoccus sp. HB161399]|uniref:Crp/Fnr family transcriptional regulator n=1 Tax=Mangrovicoccus sp. HB161399 TaxID=2720392 RepID=UPI0015536FE4|nr:Crp/Fnr family transcriptional regulator [Mangrovicoccus sp. HB161399]
MSMPSDPETDLAEEDIRKILHEVPIFASLDGPALARLQGGVRRRGLSAGQTLFEKGDAGDRVFVLLSGCLVGRDSSPGGRDLVLSRIHPGTLFGEMAVLDAEPRSLTVHAETDSQLLHMPTRSFRELLLSEPAIALNLATELARRTRLLNDQVFGLVMHDVETRLCQLLLRMARDAGECRPGGVLQPAPTHESMAAQVGANREAVSRAISRLNRLGLIETGRKRIVFRDTEAMAERGAG